MKENFRVPYEEKVYLLTLILDDNKIPYEIVNIHDDKTGRDMAAILLTDIHWVAKGKGVELNEPTD